MRKIFNRDTVVFHIFEAQQALVGMMETLNEYSGIVTQGSDQLYALEVDISHVYYHLNLAWNLRFVEEGALVKLSDDEYSQASLFPADIKYMLGR